jgi:ubiquinol-cytochrome c reductase iron-sulfur subunit
MGATLRGCKCGLRGADGPLESASRRWRPPSDSTTRRRSLRGLGQPGPERGIQMSHAANPSDPLRRLRLAATSAAGGVAFVATSVPFVASMAPALARLVRQGRPTSCQYGKTSWWTVEWRGKPVWILRRTADMLDSLRTHDGLLADPLSTWEDQQPEYARNARRSVRPDIAVLVAVCTHFGCIPTFRPDAGGRHQ